MAAVGNLFCLSRGYYIKLEINPLEYCSCFVVSLFRWHPLGTVMHPPVIKKTGPKLCGVQNLKSTLELIKVNLFVVSSKDLDMVLKSTNPVLIVHIQIFIFI